MSGNLNRFSYIWGKQHQSHPDKSIFRFHRFNIWSNSWNWIFIFSKVQRNRTSGNLNLRFPLFEANSQIPLLTFKSGGEPLYLTHTKASKIVDPLKIGNFQRFLDNLFQLLLLNENMGPFCFCHIVSLFRKHCLIKDSNHVCHCKGSVSTPPSFKRSFVENSW